ncbi:MAG: peptidase prolyl oligopeptidase active site domain protein [Bradyrhizobium sp.]|nr:peptidase prolyl oligopeptidase active site domain protein [Bradyrhizobium sp.]
MRRSGRHRYPLFQWLLGLTCVFMLAFSSMAISRQPDRDLSIAPQPEDWLEGSAPAVATWVASKNKRTRDALTRVPSFSQNYAVALQNSSLDQAQANLQFEEGFAYGLQQDATHPIGIWRRTRMAQAFDSDPHWQPLLDLDAMAKSEGRRWIFFGQSCRGNRCLLYLWDAADMSRVTTREFDIISRRFVPRGFAAATESVPAWFGKDVIVYSDRRSQNLRFGLPQTYVVRAWVRSGASSVIRDVLESDPRAAPVTAEVLRAGDADGIAIISEATTDGRRRDWLLKPDLIPIPIHLPSAGMRLVSGGQLVIRLNANWRSINQAFATGDVVSIPLDQLVSAGPRTTLVFRPRDGENLTGAALLRSVKGGLLVPGSWNVRGRLWFFRQQGGEWSRRAITLPDMGALSIAASGLGEASALIRFENFTAPPAYFSVDIAHPSSPARRLGRHQTSRFVTKQFEVRAPDGTRVPYFLTFDPARIRRGPMPVLMTGYGAYDIPELPHFAPEMEKLWLDRGGAFAVANVRGGGEFAGWNVKRLDHEKSYGDFLRIAEDLVGRGITTPRCLGVEGFSAGGTLVANSILRKPELFNAIILENAQLDLLRLDLSQTGAQGQAEEWGSLDHPDERAFLIATSPFDQLRPGTVIAPPLILTATNDTRLHPAQSRRFAARMESLGMPYFFYEHAEGGHGSGVTREQIADVMALKFTYLQQRLMTGACTGRHQ